MNRTFGKSELSNGAFLKILRNLLHVLFRGPCFCTVSHFPLQNPGT